MSILYLYGFVPADARLPERGLAGIDDVPVELIPLDGFAAVVGAVSEREFSADALEDRTSDVEWMAEQGLRHEQVVAWFVDTSTILPSRLLTLFSSAAALRASAAEESASIRARIERFTGLREWDLKVAYDREIVSRHLAEVSEEVAGLDREIAAAAPGRRFLLEKKRADLARTEAGAAARRLAGELLAELRTFARDVAVLPLPTDRAPVIANAALLVPREREADLTGRAAAERDRLAPLGLTLQLTGPWAPYRFMGEDDG